jgi:hypothetical protein
VPRGNAAIDNCRKDVPRPQQNTAPAPSDGGQAPGGAVSGVGEPHYTLPSGAVLTTQRAGEFWFLDAARGFQVQVRHTPWHGNNHVAAITAVAVRVGRHRVSIYVDGTVRLEGQPPDCLTKLLKKGKKPIYYQRDIPNSLTSLLG